MHHVSNSAKHLKQKGVFFLWVKEHNASGIDVVMVQTNVPVADVPLCSFNRAFTLHQVFAFDIMTVQTQLSAFTLQTSLP